MDGEEINTINSLPNEVLTIILQNNDISDILAFGTTCQRFWELVQNNELLWRDKLKSVIPDVMFQIVSKHCEGNWLNALKSFYNLQKKVYTEIIAMSPKFHWQCYEVTLEDVRHFFSMGLSDNINYFYVIFILQEMIRKGNALIDNNCAKKPYTLTEMFYAKVALRHLIQTFLAVKWVKSHMRNKLHPEIVVNFFLQWIDSTSLHPDFEIENRIQELVKKVEIIINAQYPKLARMPLHEKCAKKLVNEKQILKAITEAVYHQRHMAVTAAANLETLNINKVLMNRCGNVIAVGALYQAVARSCGVRCELVAFPNHLFLEWRDRDSGQLHAVDLGTGELKPKRRCPFSQVNQDSSYKYCPDSLLQYIYSAFQMSMGAIKNWNTQNAMQLLDFLGTTESHLNPYRNFLPYLLNNNHLHAMNDSLDLTYLNDAQMEIIRSLAYLNEAVKPVAKECIVKKHASVVKYAVGMICYHKKFDYVGIIRGWDVGCDVKWADHLEMELNLQFDMNQPFYYITAADQSNRYVAQENLVEITKPTRLYHLEEAVARDFSHFDGFAYVLNDEQRAEYPDEGPVAAQYRIRAHYRR